MTELTEALEASALPKAAHDIVELVERYKPQLADLVESPSRFVTELRSYLFKNPHLSDCEPASVAAGALWCAQLGLSLGPLGLFYLVPFKKQAVPVVGYRGFTALAYASGLVKDIRANLVYKGETFVEYGGSNPRLVHQVDHSLNGEGTIEHAYAIARLKTGGTVWQVIGEREWERARKASAIGKENAGPWRDSFPEMVRKTAILRLADKGELPLIPTLQTALAQDEEPAELPPLVSADD